jgi:hypothetical protein
MIPTAKICRDVLFQERSKQNSIHGRLQSQQPGFLHYLLLDGTYPDAYEMIRQTSAPDKVESLFSQTPYEYMASKGAWLVQADAETPLLLWYLCNPLAGTLLESSLPLSDIAGHLRNFIEVVLPEQEKRVVLFRFCDPRILADFLPSLDAKRREHFLAPIGRLWVPVYVEGTYALKVHDYPQSADWVWHEIIHSPRQMDEGLDISEDSHYGFVMLSPESMEALLHLRTAYSFTRLKEFFATHFPHRYFLLGEQRAETALKLLRTRALKFGLEAYEDACLLLRLCIQYGWGVMGDPRYAGKAFSAQESPRNRLLALEEACAKQQAMVLQDRGIEYGSENYAMLKRKNLALLRNTTLQRLAEGITDYNKLISALYNILPESKIFWNESCLMLFSNIAVKEANRHGYKSVEAATCIALLFFFFRDRSGAGPVSTVDFRNVVTMQCPI